jgi:hypothetical protein
VQPVLNSDLFLNPTVYHQPDATLPGYNPNDEHALLASSNLGNSAPGALCAAHRPGHPALRAAQIS